jgi:hypothetical protein
MANTYAETYSEEAGYAAPETSLSKASSTALSFLLVVCLPTAFWMSLIELTNYLASFGMALTTRLIIASAMVAFLTLIWRLIVQPASPGHLAHA